MKQSPDMGNNQVKNTKELRYIMKNLNGNVRKIKTECPFFWVSHQLIQEYAQDIRPIGIAIYCCIACCENGTTLRARISQRKIAKWLGCSKRTVVRAIKKLEETRLIRVYRHHDRVKCNEYELLSLKLPDKGIGIRCPRKTKKVTSLSAK